MKIKGFSDLFRRYQAFIPALLSTAVFRQRLRFFTDSLVHYLCEVPPWWRPKGKFRSPDRWKMHLRHFLIFLHSSMTISSFSWNLKSFMGSFEKSWLERYIQLSFMRFCKYLNQKRLRRIGE